MSRPRLLGTVDRRDDLRHRSLEPEGGGLISRFGGANGFKGLFFGGVVFGLNMVHVCFSCFF